MALRSVWAAAAACLLLAAPANAAGGVFLVTSTEPTGAGTLAAAIEAANASPGPDRIEFAVPGAGPHVIRVVEDLPPVTDPVVIDGTTQPGYAGTPIVELAADGITAVGIAFHSGSEGSTLRGLAVYRHEEHFASVTACVLVLNVDGVTVEGSYAGLRGDGSAAGCNVGVLLYNSGGNTVGGPDPTARVVASGNEQSGIRVFGPASPSQNNLVQNALVGTDPSGLAARPNGRGILVGGLGGVVDQTLNTQVVGSVIAGNSGTGVEFGEGSGGSRLTGSLVGVGLDGASVLGNEFVGVQVWAPDVLIEGNTVGNSYSTGIDVRADGAAIRDNRIGTDPVGAVPMLNGLDGITVGDAADVLIAGNTISGNEDNGITLVGPGTTGARITGNRIGTDAAGEALLPNGAIQVFVEGGARGNWIGGTEPGEGNTLGLCDPAAAEACRGIVLGPAAGVGNRIETPVGEALALAPTGAPAVVRLAIDLNDDGPSANDASDADVGPNHLQNSPDNFIVSLLGSVYEGQYTIGAAPAEVPVATAAYLLQLLREERGDALYRLVAVAQDTYSAEDHSGCGSPPCATSFTFTPPVPIAPGDLVAATATNAAGSTSEFSEPAAPVVSGEADAPGATALRLHGVTPNPTRAVSVVRFTLPEAMPVRLAVYDVLGREVAVLMEGERPAGAHEAALDGARLAAGVYVVRLTAGGRALARRLTVVR